jgi:tripartite-type tricarboxylate transporter receptor subunit TctC
VAFADLLTFALQRPLASRRGRRYAPRHEQAAGSHRGRVVVAVRIPGRLPRGSGRAAGWRAERARREFSGDDRSPGAGPGARRTSRGDIDSPRPRAAARAPADGYTLLFGTNSELVISPLLGQASYDPATAFEPIAILCDSPATIVVHPSLPVTNLKELVAYTKQHKDRMNYGSAGTGTISNLAGELFKQVAEVPEIVHIPYKGGGEVAVQLVGNHVDSTVNNPIEAVAQWRGGKLRPLCVFDSKPMAYGDPIADGKAWKDIPTCKSQGLDIEYLMLRGIFMSPRATKDQVAYYVDLFTKVRATPEWQEFMKNGAFNTSFMTGDDYAKWVGAEEKRHQNLMKEAGFLAPSN